MKRFWQILNILSVVVALVLNAVVGAQLIDVPSIAEISDRYATLLTPATYAFSIWSVLYLLLIVLAVYQARDFFQPSVTNSIPMKIGPYFILANIGNAVWTYIFVSDYIGFSVLILVGMVASLLALLYRLDIAMHEPPLRHLLFVWLPLMLYTGWVLVASVVNIASWLASIGIILGQFTAMAVLVALCCVLLALLYFRNVRELVIASTWGIAAIGVQAIDSDKNLLVTTSSFTVTAVLLLAVAIHAYINRRKNLLKYLSFHKSA